MAELRRLASRHPSWGVVVGIVVVAVVGSGIGWWATRASAASGYRVTRPTTATVRKTLVVSGSASVVRQVTADFQVAGSVSAVDVVLNQHVTAGETVASLDTTTLEKDVTSAQTALTAAKDRLAEDEAAHSSSGSTSTSPSSKSTTTTTTPPATTTTTAATAQTAPTSGATTKGHGSGTGTLSRDQQAVVKAQQVADTDAQTASADLSQAQTACSGSSPPPSKTPPTPTAAAAASAPTTTACSDALAAALAAQKQVQQDQRAVGQAETALAKLLSSSSSQTSGTSPGSANSARSTPTGGTSTPGGSGSADKTPTNGSGSPTGTGTKSTSSAGSGSAATGVGSSHPSATSSASDSAQQLASDQATIDSDDASLIDAQQNLADAQLTSPITGTVVSVGLSVGQSVEAGSATDAITIVNSGSYQATATLTPAQASIVKVGDRAQVTVTGTTGTIAGTVARVGPVDTSSSGYTYPVVVALPGGAHGISAGSSAQITITLSQAKNVRVVPTSAVHTAGGTSYLETLATGQERRDPVQVGVVGSEYTQITSTLPADTQVILADLSQAVPSSSSNSTATRAFVGGGGAFFSRRGFSGGAISIQRIGG